MADSRRAPRLHGDRGTSLAELLVGSALTVIVSAVLSTVMIGAYRSTSSTASRVQVVGEATEALQEMSRKLRTAVRPSLSVTTPFLEAGDRRVSFYSHDRPGAGPSRVTYSLDAAGRLTETRRAATVTSGAYEWTTAPLFSRVLVDGLPPTATLLRYYDDKFSTCASGCLMTTAGSPPLLAASSLKDLRMVEVTLTVSDPSRPRSRPVVLTERIGVTRNTGALPAP